MSIDKKPAIVQKATKNADVDLATHLKEAEKHLIAAVKLFSGQKKVSRRPGYTQRLISAQETITGLYREELVRIRGPIQSRRKK